MCVCVCVCVCVCLCVMLNNFAAWVDEAWGAARDRRHGRGLFIQTLVELFIQTDGMGSGKGFRFHHKIKIFLAPCGL